MLEGFRLDHGVVKGRDPATPLELQLNRCRLLIFSLLLLASGKIGIGSHIVKVIECVFNELVAVLLLHIRLLPDMLLQLIAMSAKLVVPDRKLILLDFLSVPLYLLHFCVLEDSFRVRRRYNHLFALNVGQFCMGSMVIEMRQVKLHIKILWL